MGRSDSGLNLDPALAEVQPFIAASVAIFAAIGGTSLATRVIPHLRSILGHGESRAGDFLGKLDFALRESDELIGTPFVDSFLHDGLGLDTSRKVTGTMDSLKTMKRFVGFCIILPIAMESVKLITKIPFAKRIPENFLNGVVRIPESIGISFALGMIINQAFEQSVGSEFQEWINVQKHPARLEYPVLMRLVRQHKIPYAVYNEWLNKLGYPQDLRSLLDELDTTQLSVSDVQAAVSSGLMNETQAKAYIQALGFSANTQTLYLHGSEPGVNGKSVGVQSDVDLLYDLYVNKSQTEAGTLYRSVARKALMDGHITDTQFRTILREVNIPEASITLELEALNFEKRVGRLTFTVSDIRKQYLGRELSEDATKEALTTLGYDPADIVRVIAEWNIHATTRKPTLTATKILAYLQGGVIAPEAAVGQLMEQGYSEPGARWLVQHPSAKSPEGGIPETQANIVTAYEDGIMDAAQAATALERIGLTSDEAAREIEIAQYMRHPGSTTIAQFEALEKPEIQAGYMRGTISDAEVIGLLERTGYASSDAMVIWAGWYQAKHGGPPPTIAPPGQAVVVP